MRKMNREEFKELILEWNNILLESRVYKLKEIVARMEEDNETYNVSDIAIFERFWRQNSYVSKYSQSIYKSLGLVSVNDIIRIVSEHYDRIYQTAGPSLKAAIGTGEADIYKLSWALNQLNEKQNSKVLYSLLNQFDFNNVFKNSADFEVAISDEEFVVCIPKTVKGSIALGRSYWCKNSNNLKYDLEFDSGYGPKSGNMRWCTTVLGNTHFKNYSTMHNLIYFIKKDYDINDKFRKICISLPNENYIKQFGDDYYAIGLEEYYEDEDVDASSTNVDGNNDPIINELFDDDGHRIMEEISSLVGSDRYEYLINKFSLDISSRKLPYNIETLTKKIHKYNTHSYTLDRRTREFYDNYLYIMLNTREWKTVISLVLNKNKGRVRSTVVKLIAKRIAELYPEYSQNINKDLREYDEILKKLLSLCLKWETNIVTLDFLVTILNNRNVTKDILHTIFSLYMENLSNHNPLSPQLNSFFTMYLKDRRSTSYILEEIVNIKSGIRSTMYDGNTKSNRRGFTKDEITLLLKHKNCNESILIKIVQKYHSIFNYYNLNTVPESYEQLVHTEYYGKEDKEISSLIKNSQGYTNKVVRQVVKNNTTLSRVFGITFNVSFRFLGKQIVKGFNYLERYLENKDKESQKALEDKTKDSNQDI